MEKNNGPWPPHRIDRDVFTGLYTATLLGGEFPNCYGQGETEKNAVMSLKLRVIQLRNKMLPKLTEAIEAGNAGQRPAKLLKDGAKLFIDETSVKDGTTYVLFTLTPKKREKDVQPFTDIVML